MVWMDCYTKVVTTLRDNYWWVGLCVNGVNNWLLHCWRFHKSGNFLACGDFEHYICICCLLNQVLFEGLCSMFAWLHLRMLKHGDAHRRWRRTSPQLEQMAYTTVHLEKMPLPLTVSCFSEIQIGFTFLVPAHPGSPGKRAVKWVCVCVYLLLFSRYSQLFVKSRRFWSTPPAFGAFVGGWPRSNFAGIFGVRKLESLGYRVWCSFCDPMFSRFSRTLTSDRQTDGHRPMTGTTDAWHHAVKTNSKLQLFAKFISVCPSTKI